MTTEKNCKIISTYFGPRRNKPNGIDDTIKFWDEKVLKKELEIDPGVPLDTIIVNHHFGNERVKQYLDNIEGMKTKRGVIKIHNRNWGDGVGASFLSFSKGFKKFMDEYDYFFFTEDNVIMIHDDYYKIALEQLNKNEKTGFICCMRAGSSNYPTGKKWCHGGCGLTEKKYLLKIIGVDGELPHSKRVINKDIQDKIFKDDLTGFKINSEIQTTKSSWYKEFCVRGEIEFTNKLFQLGYNLEEIIIDGYCANWHTENY